MGTFDIEVPNDEDTKNLSALIYAEADDLPFKNKSQIGYTDEMIAIGRVVMNRIDWVKKYPSDKNSFCADTYLNVIRCKNKWGAIQFLSYNNSKYNQLIENKIPNEIQQRFARACIDAAKNVIYGNIDQYAEFMGFNQSPTYSPFSATRTIGSPVKIGAYYFWTLATPWCYF